MFIVGLTESFARSLARYISSVPQIALVGVAPSITLAQIMLPATQTDLALVDWSALNGAARDSIRLLHTGQLGLHIVCVVNEGEPYRADAMRMGADAVISKDEFAVDFRLVLHDFFPDRIGISGSPMI